MSRARGGVGVSPELRQLLGHMGISTALPRAGHSPAGLLATAPLGAPLRAQVAWQPDPSLFALWKLDEAPASLAAMLEAAPLLRHDDPIAEDVFSLLRRVEEAIVPPEWDEPRVVDLRAFGGERRLIEDVISPFFDTEVLVAVAQSLPSEPRREEGAGAARPRVAHIGSIEPQPLPRANAGFGGARSGSASGSGAPGSSRSTLTPRYLPMLPPPEAGRSWGKTILLGTVVTAAGVALLWALLGLPVPGAAPQAHPATASRSASAMAISGPATSPAPASSHAAAVAAPAAAALGSALPVTTTASSPAAPTYTTKNGPKTLDQIRAELRASGYPFGSSTNS
ncbi:MAG TPA: hypothetical protein VMV93_09800, partial [Chloroflexota bacterium]|nr:hypothetical protein [Chloroflexota bacterium]